MEGNSNTRKKVPNHTADYTKCFTSDSNLIGKRCICQTHIESLSCQRANYKNCLTWKHNSDSSTKKVANFPEQSFIQQRSVKASILPFHFVLDKIVKKLLYCPALSAHSVDDTLVNSFQNKRNSAHQSWFQQIGITFGTTCHFGAFVCQSCRWAYNTRNYGLTWC